MAFRSAEPAVPHHPAICVCTPVALPQRYMVIVYKVSVKYSHLLIQHTFWSFGDSLYCSGTHIYVYSPTCLRVIVLCSVAVSWQSLVHCLGVNL